MTYTVGTLWIIYASVLVGTWVLLSIFNKHGLGWAPVLFIATIIAAIAAFIGAAWLDPNQLSDNDKSWLAVLFMVAFLLPVILIVCMLFFSKSNTCQIKHTYQCNKDTGEYTLKAKTYYHPDGDITEVIY